MPVRLNDFNRQWQDVEADAMAAMRRVGASGWYILGREVEQFEAALAAAWPQPCVVGVGSGLDALEIALRCLDVGRGDRVLTTPLSAFATTLAIVRAGAIPVFVDTDESGLLDLERCEALLRHRDDIRCILPVHLYGHALDLERLERLKHAHDLKVVEDCAQSIGAAWLARPTGTVGQVAATSFYPTKNLGAMGDGGAVLTGRADLAERARALRHYGQTATYVHDQIGLNSRLDELHAAVLHDALLPRLAGWTERRRAVAAAYRDGIANPPVVIPRVPTGSASSWHLFPILVAPEDRASLVEHLRSLGVQAGIHYPRLIPEQRALAQSDGFEVVGELERARQFAGGEVSLPIHPYLTDAEVETVVDACNAWRP